MRAIQVIHENDGPRLLWAEAEEPAMGPDDVLVDIQATTLNRADLSQAAGNYPPPPGASPILGLDMAGTIVALGANVRGWQVGDRVCALLTGGGYAERTVVDHRMLFPIPAGWDWGEAAALPEVYLTAFVNIFMEAAFQPGETVLVHGGASGVGTAAIQLVKAAGGTVVITAGKAEKVAICRQLGADRAINYNEEDFVPAARSFTGGAGVDIILDMVGAAYLQRNIGLLKVKGRLVWIATLGGAVGEIDIGQLMGKRARLIGSVLRARPLAEKLAIVRRFQTQFWPHVESGVIRPVIDRSFPLTGQLTRYLLEHPSLFAALPDQFELVLLPQNDTELQLYNLRLLEKFGSEGRPVVLARLHRTGVDMTHQPPPQIYVPLVA